MVTYRQQIEVLENHLASLYQSNRHSPAGNHCENHHRNVSMKLFREPQHHTLSLIFLTIRAHQDSQHQCFHIPN